MEIVKSVYIFWLVVVGVFGQPEAAEEEIVTVRAEYCPEDYGCSLPFTSYVDASRNCSCHPACSVFLDCCYNVGTYNKHEGTPHVNDVFLDAIEGYKEYFQCTTDIFSREKYWMVSTCPPSWPVPHNCDLVDNNSTPTIGDLQDLASIPVISSDGITFRNIYCALCHSQEIDSLTPWSLEAACDDASGYRANANLTLVEKVQDLIDLCDSVSFVPPADHPLNIQTAVPCRVSAEELHTCNNTSYDEIYYCSTVQAPIEVDLITFKNRYCAECYYETRNNTELIILEKCGDRTLIPGECIDFDGYWVCSGPTPPLVPISITFDFGSESGGLSISSENNQIESVSVTCEEGQVFDPTSFECLQLTCPVGYTIQENHCIRNGSAPACEGFFLDITIEMPQYSKQQCKDNFTFGSELFIECVPADILDTFSAMELSNMFSCFDNRDALLFKLEMKISSDQVSNLFSPKHLNNNSSSGSGCQSSSIVFSAACISDEDLICEDFSQNQLQWSIVDTPPPTLLFHSTNVTLDVSGVRFGRDLHFAENEGIVETFLIQNCRCPFVTLGASHFYNDESASDTLIYARNESFRFTPSMYSRNEDESINVCNFLESEGEIYRFFPEYSLAQSIVSTIGISLSVVALTLSLVTYCLFSELRNRIAPILIMNLCGCLIISQVCLLFAGIAASSPTICAIIAGAGHFFWLAAFSSSTLVGVSLTRAFSLRNQTNVGEKPSCAASLTYIAGSFVVPVAVCGTLITLYMMDEDGRYSIAYGGVGGCWIGDSLVNILAFGLPVAISLTLNFVLFVYIVVSLCIQHKQSRRMKSFARGVKRREFLVYTRIFIVLGLTWVSGFVASSTDLDSFWYAFIILMSLQGVFIFTAFTFKSRVYSLWREKLCKQKPSRTGKTSSTESSKTQGSKKTDDSAVRGNIKQETMAIFPMDSIPIN